MQDLIERLQAATEGSRELDADISHFLRKPWAVTIGDGLITEERHIPARLPHYTTSLDAALTLLEDINCLEVLSRRTQPEMGGRMWSATIVHLGKRSHSLGQRTPALALSIAALKARMEVE